MRILTIGDIHAPCEKEGYLEFCKDIYKAWSCDAVVFAGDVIDMHNVSRFEPEADAPGPRDEADMAAEAVARWHKAFPIAKVCIGNHDSRVTKAAQNSKVPGTRFIRTYNEAWGTKGWTWKYSFDIEGVYYFHGDGYTGLHPAYNAAKQMAMSVVMGHSHTSGGVKWMANPRKQWFGMDTGCGIDDTRYAFYYAKQMKKRPIISCGVVIDGYPYHEIMR